MDAVGTSDENVVCNSIDEINIDRNDLQFSVNFNSTFDSSSVEINSDSQGSIISSTIQSDLKHLPTNISPLLCELINTSDRGSIISESAHQQELFSKFQTWALKNYGESGKTKTVTRSKYLKVINILKGVENAITENSKLRFWVKAKGFRLGRGTKDFNDFDREVLYIPAKNSCCLEVGERSLKRVAVVEDFFQIIYNVHVDMDGRGGKHAGQKRTYRAIAETYAFLPREAVTKFLMSCTDCQKRMHFSIENLEQKLIGRTSPLKYSKIEAHDQMKYRRSVKRVKGSNEQSKDRTSLYQGLTSAPTSEFFGQKKVKVESDHVTNYTSRRDLLVGGTSSETIGHSREFLELKSSVEEISTSDVPLDLSISKQNNTQLKKETFYHHDFGRILTQNRDIALPEDTSIKHIYEQNTNMEILPTKHLLPFFSNTPFISNYFFRNFCTSTFKSSFPSNKFHLPTDLNSNEDFYGQVLRTYHYEESNHFQIAPRNGYNLPKLSNLRQILSLPQIIAGYRDSATFLRRSADELECFLQRTV